MIGRQLGGKLSEFAKQNFQLDVEQFLREEAEAKEQRAFERGQNEFDRRMQARSDQSFEEFVRQAELDFIKQNQQNERDDNVRRETQAFQKSLTNLRHNDPLELGLKEANKSIKSLTSELNDILSKASDRKVKRTEQSRLLKQAENIKTEIEKARLIQQAFQDKVNKKAGVKVVPGFVNDVPFSPLIK